MRNLLGLNNVYVCGFDSSGVLKNGINLQFSYSHIRYLYLSFDTLISILDCVPSEL